MMEIVEKLTNLGTVEVSVHGRRENYFEPTAAICCCCVFRRDEESDLSDLDVER